MATQAIAPLAVDEDFPPALGVSLHPGQGLSNALQRTQVADTGSVSVLEVKARRLPLALGAIGGAGARNHGSASNTRRHREERYNAQPCHARVSGPVRGRFWPVAPLIIPGP